MGKMYSVDEIRSIFGCSREKVYQIIHSVGFPKVKIGRQYYIPEEKFKSWLENRMNSCVVL